MNETAVLKKPAPLSNNDFRQFLFTPRGSNGLTETSKQPEPVSGERRPPNTVEKKLKKRKYTEAMRREDVLAKLQAKYRDRAQERRDGHNPDYVHVTEERELQAVSTGAYHAVAPDAGYNRKQAIRRRQLIQESKYLGGDMAHTHLVKGLDYALLNKVRQEIEVRNKEAGIVEGKIEEITPKETSEQQPAMTRMGKAILDAVLIKQCIERNPLFAPGKMSYLVHLEGEEAELEIPTVVVKSNKEVDPDSHIRSMTTTDAVIEKLKSVLSHIKEGEKMRRPKKFTAEAQQTVDRGHEEKKSKTDTKCGESKKDTTKGLDKKGQKTRERLLKRLSSEPTGYAECYPGHVESVEATYDSDEAADYTKMDRTKKGVVGRWDFDHEEEYSEYMTRREALPKAAFQYGLKKSGGRKTRKGNSDKAALDRLWGEIKSKMQQMKSGTSYM